MSAANSFGYLFKITTFGESHGLGLGAVIDGCPAGVPWNQDLLNQELKRRRPGSSAWVSSRQELDQPQVISGVFEGKTLGTPIAILVKNEDTRPQDYQTIQHRSGHADDLWFMKFGHQDPRGGGRASGRETLSRVIGGAIAKMYLKVIYPELKIVGFSRSIGPVRADDESLIQKVIQNGDPYPFDTFPARFPTSSPDVKKLLQTAKEKGFSYGGQAEIRVLGMPIGLGEPVFHKLKSDLASACMSVGASCSFEIGSGFKATQEEGSQFHHHQTPPYAYGGIRGGISTGETIVFCVGFKPTSSILEVALQGRHDPCIVPRAVCVLEAMTALVLADHTLQKTTNQV